ncbi:hypothetical protein CPB97_004691, partial [Podila verticillata]
VSVGLGQTLLLCKPGQDKLQDMPKWPVQDVEEHCIECLNAEYEDNMLLCDKCDSGTHLHCTVPRLQSTTEVSHALGWYSVSTPFCAARSWISTSTTSIKEERITAFLFNDRLNYTLVNCTWNEVVSPTLYTDVITYRVRHDRNEDQLGSPYFNTLNRPKGLYKYAHHIRAITCKGAKSLLAILEIGCSKPLEVNLSQ